LTLKKYEPRSLARSRSFDDSFFCIFRFVHPALDADKEIALLGREVEWMCMNNEETPPSDCSTGEACISSLNHKVVCVLPPETSGGD
jgi:hypothetical protein